MFPDDFINKFCIVLFGALLFYFRVADTSVYVISQQHHTGAFSAILIIYPFWHSRLHGQGRHHLLQQLAGTFIHAQPYGSLFSWLLVQPEPPFHISQVLTIYLTNTPLLL